MKECTILILLLSLVVTDEGYNMCGSRTSDDENTRENMDFWVVRINDDGGEL